jgi:hypothetical protein
MNWRAIKAYAKTVFPKLKPSRIAGISMSADAILLACHDQDVAVVLYHRTDLLRVRNCCDAVLKQRNDEHDGQNLEEHQSTGGGGYPY